MHGAALNKQSRYTEKVKCGTSSQNPSENGKNTTDQWHLAVFKEYTEGGLFLFFGEKNESKSRGRLEEEEEEEVVVVVWGGEGGGRVENPSQLFSIVSQ